MDNTTVNQPTLKYDILLEKAGAEGYTARVLAWPDLVVKAATREAALAQIRIELLMRLAKADIVTLEFTPEEINNPWLKFAGMWADNPDLDEFLAEIERNRRELDAQLAPWLFEPEGEPAQEPEKAAVAT